MGKKEEVSYMKFLAFISVCLFFAVACTTKAPVQEAAAPTSKTTTASACTGDQSLPMLGYKENHVADACDKKFIETVLLQSDNDRTLAAKTMREYGWKALEKNSASAVKRFNQAWLLDRKNFETIWGFGVWELKRGNTAKAKEFLGKAIAMAPKPVPTALQETWDQVQKR